MSDPVKVTVLGTGSWGTALASVLANNGHEVTIWGRNAKICAEISQHHTNTKYLPKISLPATLICEPDIDAALKSPQLALLATPAQTVAAMAVDIKGKISDTVPLLLSAKGINRQTLKLPAQSIHEILPKNPVAALSGPSFAMDVAKGQPTAVTIASSDQNLAQQLASVFSSPTFRCYAANDLIGVELGGALKNVFAVAVGICRGLELGASAEAALIARSFAELCRLATGLGADRETLMGLSGLGDLVLSCSSTQSRNFSYGCALARGEELKDHPLAEGALTATVAWKIAQNNNVDCPIIECVAKLVDHAITPQEAVQKLLSRPLKKESD